MNFSEIKTKPNEVSKMGDKSEFDIDKRADISQIGSSNTDKTFDIDKRVDTESDIKSGGSYKEVKKNSGEGSEVHHMPADCVSPLERDDGPAIKMDKEDHMQTASWGASREAGEYRAHQKELINNGDFKGAVQMDIDDIKSKFGDKYDKQISQMLNYVNKLETGGKI